jgi:hypothetical protein
MACLPGMNCGGYQSNDCHPKVNSNCVDYSGPNLPCSGVQTHDCLTLAIEKIDDSSLDFLFLDTFTDHKSIVNDINQWYHKVKPGGIFAGHDWQSLLIQQEINNFRVSNRISNPLSTFDFIWAWIK